MRLRLREPNPIDIPRAGERIRLADGRFGRVVKITTRWETTVAGEPAEPDRLLRADLWVVADAKVKA